MTTTTNGTDWMRERLVRLNDDLAAAMKAARAADNETAWGICSAIGDEILALERDINRREYAINRREFDAYWAGSIGARAKTPLTSPDQQRA